MATKIGMEQEIADNIRQIAELEKQVKEIRDYVVANEHSWQNASEPLRSITQEGVAKARSNLAIKESDLQRVYAERDKNQRILATISSVESLQQYIDKYSELLEKARSDLLVKEQEFLDLTNPMVIPAHELIFATGARIALPIDRTEILIGCRDPGAGILPDVDLSPFGGQASGASRRHAKIHFLSGRWMITDLGSMNGTFIYETAVAPNVPTVLPANARLRFGKIEATFQASSIGHTTRL